MVNLYPKHVRGKNTFFLILYSCKLFSYTDVKTWSRGHRNFLHSDFYPALPNHFINVVSFSQKRALFRYRDGGNRYIGYGRADVWWCWLHSKRRHYLAGLFLSCYWSIYHLNIFLLGIGRSRRKRRPQNDGLCCNIVEFDFQWFAFSGFEMQSDACSERGILEYFVSNKRNF